MRYMILLWLLCIVCFYLWTYFEDQVEINLSEYRYINEMVIKYPDLLPIVLDTLDDGKITRYELEGIRNEIFDLEKKDIIEGL